MSADQNLQQFEKLLKNLLSDTNEVRKEAEAIFQQFMQQQPDGVIHALLAISRQSQDDIVRQLAVTYIRSLVDSKDYFTKLSPNTVTLLKKELFKSLEVEQNYKLRRYISDAISTFASTLFSTNKNDPIAQWPELLDILLQFVKSPLPEHRENGLLILGPLSPLLITSLQQRFNELLQVFWACLNDPQKIQVKIEALNALVYVILVMKEQKYRHEFHELQKLIPAMLEVIASALNARNEKDANTAIQTFADLAELVPLFLRPHIGTVVDAMFKISSAEILTNVTRQTAMEVLVTLAENKPGLCRKLTGFAKTILEILLKMMLEVHDISLDEWNKQIDDETVDEEDNSVVAQTFLDRVCIALGGKTVVPIVFQHIPAMVQSNDWRHRFTALMTISLIGEGACNVLKPYLKSIVELIVPLFSDSHPRVRWAAVNAAGQMSTDFAPTIQEEFYEVILPRIIALLDDKSNPRVQRHAAAASINFFEHFEKDKCPPFLGPFLSKILDMLHHGTRDTQEEALTALAAAADCAKEHFIPYYETFVPLLKDILARAHSRDYRVLRSKAVETISLIGVAVGKEKFAADAKEVMELLQRIYANPLEEDDPLREHGLRAYARICQCLGQDFVPYMPMVMPSLIKSASIEPELKILPINDVDVDSLLEEEDEGWQFTPIHNKFVGIRTAILDEKATAVNMILCYIRELKEGFFPWLNSVVNILVPLVEFYYHDGVRGAALACMGPLIECAASYVKKNNGDRRLVKELFDFVINKILGALPKEINPELTAIGTSAIHECIDAAGEGIISDQQIKEALQVVKFLTEYAQKRLKHRLTKKSEDDTVDDEERQLYDEEDQKDQEILMEVADVIGILARQCKANFLPYFQECAPLAFELLQPNQHHALRQLGLCMFDDVIEHCGPGAHQYLPQVVPYMMNYMSDTDTQVRQAAVYGIGVVADKAREHFAPLVSESIKRLLTVIKAPDSRKDNNAFPTDNAISSLGKILFFHSQVIPQNEFLDLLVQWLNFLPVVDDEIEAPHVHRLLCDFIESERFNSHLIGQNFQNLPKVLSIFAHVLDSELIDSQTRERIVNILKKMQQTFPAATLQQIIGLLPNEQQKKLGQVFLTA